MSFNFPTVLKKCYTTTFKNVKHNKLNNKDEIGLKQIAVQTGFAFKRNIVGKRN